MHILYQQDDPHLNETLLHIANNAAESPNPNNRLQAGSITLSCTANAVASGTTTFAKPYKKGTTPTVIPGISSLGNTSSQVTVSASANNTTVTVNAYSSVTQNVTVSFIAIGQTGGA